MRRAILLAIFIFLAIEIPLRLAGDTVFDASLVLDDRNQLF
jgi:hypothetical protein